MPLLYAVLPATDKAHRRAVTVAMWASWLCAAVLITLPTAVLIIPSVRPVGPSFNTAAQPPMVTAHLPSSRAHWYSGTDTFDRLRYAADLTTELALQQDRTPVLVLYNRVGREQGRFSEVSDRCVFCVVIDNCESNGDLRRVCCLM